MGTIKSGKYSRSTPTTPSLSNCRSRQASSKIRGAFFLLTYNMLLIYNKEVNITRQSKMHKWYSQLLNGRGYKVKAMWIRT